MRYDTGMHKAFAGVGKETTMKLFGIIGVWELAIVIVIIAVIFGPAIFVKAHKRMKKTGQAAKKGLREGAKKAGIDVDGTNPDGSQKTAVDHINDFQDRVDDWFESKEDLDIGDAEEK